MLRLAGTLFYAAAALIILILVFTNRETVTVSLAPLHGPIAAPLYIWLATMFALGLGLGLLYAMTVSVSLNRKLRRQARALSQYENDVNRFNPPSPPKP